MKTAKDIMVTEVITVNPQDNVEKVAHLLLEHRISGMPVVDDSGRLVGVVSEADLVFQEKGVKSPFFMVVFDSPIYFEHPGRLVDDIKRAAARKVNELMSTKLYTVGPETAITDIATIFTKNKINRVPVVDENNKILGIISRQDIIRASFSSQK
ncbi:MAG: CBS domain-containing protein [Firmicutes bacterium]|nr:CBS domain-containing protein [Bacillota bacterium]